MIGENFSPERTILVLVEKKAAEFAEENLGKNSGGSGFFEHVSVRTLTWNSSRHGDATFSEQSWHFDALSGSTMQKDGAKRKSNWAFSPYRQDHLGGSNCIASSPTSLLEIAPVEDRGEASGHGFIVEQISREAPGWGVETGVGSDDGLDKRNGRIRSRGELGLLGIVPRGGSPADASHFLDLAGKSRSLKKWRCPVGGSKFNP